MLLKSFTDDPNEAASVLIAPIDDAVEEENLESFLEPIPLSSHLVSELHLLLSVSLISGQCILILLVDVLDLDEAFIQIPGPLFPLAAPLLPFLDGFCQLVFVLSFYSPFAW